MGISIKSMRLAACYFPVMLMLSPLPSVAAETSLGVSATVTAGACIWVATPDVDLGSFHSSGFTTAGSASDWVGFNVSLSQCPATTQTVTVTLGGTADPTYQQYYKNLGDSTRVVIDVVSDNDAATQLPVGKKLTVNVEQAAHTATFPMKARMFSPQGGATEGSVVGLIELTFSYG